MNANSTANILVSSGEIPRIKDQPSGLFRKISIIPPQSQVLLKLNDVISMTRLSRSSIYSAIKSGAFPSSVRIGKRSTAWVRSEVEDYISQQIDRSRPRT